MIPGASDPFGVPLAIDPSVALPAISLSPTLKSGPLHKVQFVIEFVGPRSIAATTTRQLLSPEWHQALGEPTGWVMRPADLQWQPLNTLMDGSIDSLALTWDMVTSQGNLSSASALQLLQFTERFGPTISRRAMPMPHPAEVNGRVRDLLAIRDSLDIGVSLMAVARSAFLERDLWVECARLGLEFSPAGSFDWRVPGSAYPLLSVTPIGGADAFSLGNVHAGLCHEAVTIGFSVPRCIAPVQALDGCFRIAHHVARSLGGVATDDANRPLTERAQQELQVNLRQALGMFSQAGITTGSPEAHQLFG